MTSVKDLFEIAHGSTIGRHHLYVGKNNQDAVKIAYGSAGEIVAVVCDGCGSGEFSEVGAQLGSSIIAKRFSNPPNIFIDPTGLIDLDLELEDKKKQILNDLKGASWSTFEGINGITKYFLFTCLVAIIGYEHTLVISIGDGTVVVNGEIIKLGPYANNAPPYIAYNLIKKYIVNVNEKDLNFKVVRIIPTNELDSLMLATDGIDDFERADELAIPGKKELVGPISQFWTDDRYFSNQQAINRKLALVNRTSVRLDRKAQKIQREVGWLQDDTTLVVIRRKNNDSLSTGEKT